MSARPRIALCLEYPLAQHGGVEVLVRELVAGLAATHEVSLVSADTPDDIARHPLSAVIQHHFEWKPDEAKRSQSARLVAWARLHQIDLLHFHLGGTYCWNARSWSQCPLTLIAASGLPCVSTNHGAFSLFDCIGAQRPWWQKWLGLAIFWPGKLRQVSAMRWEATVSRHDFRAVCRWFSPVRGKFTQLYHSKLAGLALPNREKKRVILCLGTVGPRKGQPYLVEAFALLATKFPTWRLIIAGRHADPQTSAAVRDSMDRHHLAGQVEIQEKVTDDSARDLLSQSAIFAMPSTAEGLGLSLQEALFNGAACIGTAVGGIPELIENERTGLLVPPENPAALAAGLERLMTDEVLRERLGETGRRSVFEKGMTSPQMVENYAARYAEILRQYSSSPA